METPQRIIVERLLQERRCQAAAERVARLNGAAQRGMPAPTPRSAPAKPRASADAVCGDVRAAREAA